MSWVQSLSSAPIWGSVGSKKIFSISAGAQVLHVGNSCANMQYLESPKIEIAASWVIHMHPSSPCLTAMYNNLFQYECFCGWFWFFLSLWWCLRDQCSLMLTVLIRITKKEERAGNRLSLGDAEFTRKRLLAAKMIFATVLCGPLWAGIDWSSGKSPGIAERGNVR